MSVERIGFRGVSAAAIALAFVTMAPSCSRGRRAQDELPAGGVSDAGAPQGSGQVGPGSAGTPDRDALDERFAPSQIAPLVPTTMEVVKHDTSRPLGARRSGMNTLSLSAPEKPRQHELQPLPIPRHLGPAPLATPSLSADKESPPLALSFEGIGNSMPGFEVAWYPPDPDGDIGHAQYVQLVNASFAVFDRRGHLVMAPRPTSDIWAVKGSNGQPFGGPCTKTNDGDGTVVYDRRAKRWVIAQFTRATGAYEQCLAVSLTDDPTGQYYRYEYRFDHFNDYPKMAQWGNAYVFTFNMYESDENNAAFLGSRICAFNRDAVLKGASNGPICFDNPKWGGLLAADYQEPDGDASGPVRIFAIAMNGLAIWNVTLDWAQWNKSRMSQPYGLRVTPYAELCGNVQRYECIPQQGSAIPLNAVSDRAMNRVVYRRASDSVVLSHAIATTNGGGVRWYEIGGIATGMFRVVQQGTHAPDAGYRFLSSVAIDRVGNIALGYAVAGKQRFPSAAYSLHETTDGDGMMQRERIIAPGMAAQNDEGGSRYGDYSAMRVDPVDGCTFWYTQQYAAANGKWNTRIATFRAPSCTRL